MPSCVALRCSNRSSNKSKKKVSLYRFPFSNEERLQRWVTNIRRKDWAPKRDSRLCEEHFEEDCFHYTTSFGKKLKRLLPKAVPTIFNYYQSHGLTVPILPKEDKTRSTPQACTTTARKIVVVLEKHPVPRRMNRPASPDVCVDHNYTTETSGPILNKGRTKEEMKMKLTQLQQTQIRLKLHANILGEYLRNEVIPLELRVQMAPTIGSYNKDFNKKWCDALDKCSLDLIRLIVAELSGQKEAVGRDIVNQEALMMRKLGDDFTMINRYIKTSLRSFEEGLRAERLQLYDRDRLDHQLNRVYKWTFDGPLEEQNPAEQQSHDAAAELAVTSEPVREEEVTSEPLSGAAFNQPQQGLNLTSRTLVLSYFPPPDTGESGRTSSSSPSSPSHSQKHNAKDTVISLSVKEMRQSQMMAQEKRRRAIVAKRRRKLESLKEPKNGVYFVLKFPDGSTKKRKFLRSQPFQNLVAFAGSDDVASEVFSIQPLSSQTSLQSTLTGSISDYIDRQTCILQVLWFSSQLQDTEIVDSVTKGMGHCLEKMRRDQMQTQEQRRRAIIAERRRRLESLTEHKHGVYFVLKYPDGSIKKRKFLRSQPFQDLVAFAGSDDVASEVFSIQPLSSQTSLQSTLTGSISDYIDRQTCILQVLWFSSQLQDTEIVDSVTEGTGH